MIEGQGGGESSEREEKNTRAKWCPRIISGALEKKTGFSHRRKHAFRSTDPKRSLSGTDRGASRAARSASCEMEKEKAAAAAALARPTTPPTPPTADIDGALCPPSHAFHRALRASIESILTTPSHRPMEIAQSCRVLQTAAGHQSRRRAAADRRNRSPADDHRPPSLGAAVPSPPSQKTPVAYGLQRRTLRFLLICVIVALECLVKDRESRRGGEKKKKRVKGAGARRRRLFFLFIFVSLCWLSHYFPSDLPLGTSWTRSSAPPSARSLAHLFVAST